jgi:HAD superfamily phosphoserine phosphatase-like hydrolase
MTGRAHPRIAAFFDLDGTLVPPPSLEWRLFRLLRYRGVIRASHLLRWVAEAARLLPQDRFAVRHGNKMHLRGVSAEATASFGKIPITFSPEGMERVLWHAGEGHAIVLVSGTLEPLANLAARAIEVELRERGREAEVYACATQLEEFDGRWTGRILGEPMSGPAKADAARRIARREGIDMARSYAYGNSEDDRWLLAAVRRPAAVNPSRRLASIARNEDWPVLRWDAAERFAKPRSLRGNGERSPAKRTEQKWEPNQ